MDIQKCLICGHGEGCVASALGVCRECIINRRDEAHEYVERMHRFSRRQFSLPTRDDILPKEGAPDAVTCIQCVNKCRIPPGKLGLCGLKENKKGEIHIRAGTKNVGFVEYYYDPLPTNCVAAWVCGEKARGDYRKKSPLQNFLTGMEKNLAVFYQSCTFDCAFCQNWHFREALHHPHEMSSAQLSAAVDNHTRCVCYFGGDPASQLPHSIATSLEIMKRTKKEVRLCWETNGSANPRMMHKVAEIALETGGTIKFDLKAFTPEVHYALTGCSNENTLTNFRELSRMMEKRPEPPLLSAATLLVPGYINLDEIRLIARFIADCNPQIPYTLLAFYPDYLFPDLPVTSAEHAQKGEDVCKGEGLTNINIGNIHLLSDSAYPI